MHLLATLSAVHAVLAFGVANDWKPNAPAVMVAVLTRGSWPDLYGMTGSWAKRPGDKFKLLKHLSNALFDRTYVGLEEPQDVIIGYRLARGDLIYQGHGGVVRQDLFLVGGRAAWAIYGIIEPGDGTGKNLPELNAGLSADEWATRVAEIRKRVQAYREEIARRRAGNPD